MNNNFASVNDIIARGKSLTAEESETAELIIQEVSSQLRYNAQMVGKNIDEMIADIPGYEDIVRGVVCDVVKRYLTDNDNNMPAMTQLSESAMGYTISGSPLSPGGGVFIKRSELARLGLRRQQMGVIDLC